VGRESPLEKAKEIEMAEGVVDVTIQAAPDEVWAKIGDFGALDEIFPAIDSIRLEGDDRVLGMGGNEVRERLLSRDDATRTLVYSIVEGIPVERHQATVTVAADGDGSKVTWAYEVEPADMVPMLDGAYQGILANLDGLFS
jgi:Polyketide cyclase / dehydrase and lipid transport